MSIWKHLMMVLSVCLLATAFVACGDDDDDEEPACEVAGDIECCADADCTAPAVCNLSTNVCEFVPCETGETACGEGVCADLQTNNDNCGGCGTACVAPEGCMDGECRECTNTAEIPCAGTCTDTMTDDANCGVCGNACGTGQTCTAGECVCDDAALSDCSGTCLDLLTDINNCGECGNMCGVNETCAGGDCVCADDLRRCDGVCTDVTLNRAHCNECNNACEDGDGTTTQGQTCVYYEDNFYSGCASCNAPRTRCGNDCERLELSANHCGACDAACADNHACVPTDVDTDTDTPDVPTCTDCDAGFACPVFVGNPINADIIQCVPNNEANCGACGVVCASDEICEDSACVADPVCDTCVAPEICAYGQCLTPCTDVTGCNAGTELCVQIEFFNPFLFPVTVNIDLDCDNPVTVCGDPVGCLGTPISNNFSNMCPSGGFTSICNFQTADTLISRIMNF